MRSNITLALVLALAGCGKHETAIRHYREITIAPTAMPPAASMPLPPADEDALHMAWTTPAGWTEKPSSGGMRLATFAVGNAECTIVSFPGDSGGVVANLKRWFGQLQVEVDEAKLSNFADTPEKLTSDGGFDVSVFNLGTLLPESAPSSMLTAIVIAEGQTVFVKLTGSPSFLNGEAENFRALCKSLRHE